MKKLVSGLILILALLLLSCAPRAAPTPTPTIPKAPAPTPVVAAPTPLKVSPEEAEWQKVVEAAQKEGRATLYGGTYAGETGIEVVKAFKARYNINLEIITGRGSEFIERLKTERRIGQRVADLISTSPLSLLELKNSDLLEVSSGLPALRNKGDFNVDPVLDKDSQILLGVVYVRTPMVNTKLVKPDEEPKSWQDLLNPKWKGKMLAYNSALTAGMYNTFIPLLNAKAITLEWLRAIGKQDLILLRGDQEIVERLARGDAPLALAATDAYAASYVKEGASIKAIPMNEGVVLIFNGIAQVKNASHPNIAKLFINWVFSTEGQSVYNKARGSRPVRKDVPDFTPEALRLPPTAKLVPETVTDIEEENKKFVDKWIIELWKQ